MQDREVETHHAHNVKTVSANLTPAPISFKELVDMMNKKTMPKPGKGGKGC